MTDDELHGYLGHCQGCGCPEMKSCGLWARMTRETDGLIASQCINQRYKAYNAYFYGRRKDGWDG